MTIKDAIKMLQSYDENEEIHIQWWDRECYADLHDITEKEWNIVVHELEEYHFDGITETISDAIEQELQIIRSKE